MYQLTENPDQVIRVEDDALIPRGHRWWDDYQEWLAVGNTPLPVPAPTFADYVAAFLPQFQQWMEDVARSNAYDSVLSCASYAGSGVPQFAQDAAAMIAWRDALWVWAAQWQAGFNGQLPETIPTFDEVKAQAPQPASFGWVVHSKGG